MRHGLYNCWKLIRPSRIEHHIREGRLEGTLASFVAEISDRYIDGSKGMLNSYRDITEYNGSTMDRVICRLNKTNELIATVVCLWFYAMESGCFIPCIRHNCFSVNIILEVKNFRFYRCKIENEDGKFLEQRILSHRRLNGCVGETLYLKSLNNEYKLDIQQ